MLKLKLTTFAVLILLSACGFLPDGASTTELYDPTVPTQSNPVITRVSVAAATAGDTVTLFGYGFSDVPANNIVILSGTTIFADTYGLVVPPAAGEIEFLTFTVPAGLTLGVNSVYLDVLDNVSNDNLSLTIN